MFPSHIVHIGTYWSVYIFTSRCLQAESCNSTDAKKISVSLSVYRSILLTVGTTVMFPSHIVHVGVVCVYSHQGVNWLKAVIQLML